MVHHSRADRWLVGLIALSRASLFGAMIAAAAVMGSCVGNHSTAPSTDDAGTATGTNDAGDDEPPPTLGGALCSTDADCVTPCKATPNYIKWTSLNNQGVEPNNYTTVRIRCNYEKKCIRYLWGGGMTSRASDSTNQGQVAFIQYCK